LVERLAEDVVRYDPVTARSVLGDRAPSLKIEATDDHFVAWGPLTRFPESCASPPIYRLSLAALSLISLPFFPPGGMIAGYLIASAGHDLIMHQHFRQTGFRMDRDGVWVRGKCLTWDELEHATLMPVCAGPLFFAGDRHVLVTGYMGGTYGERAWLGCAAWRWIQDNICEID
jgi:hypothetical protein